MAGLARNDAVCLEWHSQFREDPALVFIFIMNETDPSSECVGHVCIFLKQGQGISRQP